MLSKLHHVAIAVRDAEEALGFYRDILGLRVSVDRVMDREGLRGILLPIGESEIELLEPIGGGGAVAKFIEARGPGLHHICFETDDCGVELQLVSERGAALIDQEPRLGLAGMIGFLHPKSNHGVLVELATPLGDGHHGSDRGDASDGKEWVQGIHEVGIVVRDRHNAEATFVRHFELAKVVEPSERDGSLASSASFLRIGGSRLALMEPTGEDGSAAKFARDRGEGLFLVTLEVVDLQAAVERLRTFGAECSDPTAEGEAFVAPSATSGVNLRLIEIAPFKSHQMVENHG